MSDEEVSAALRAEADERRRKALAVVEPLDLSSTTWPEYPPHTVVNAITYVARRGLHRYLEGSPSCAPSSPAATTCRPSGSSSATAPRSCSRRAAQSLISPGDELITPWPSYPLYPVMARRAHGKAVPVPGFCVDEILAAVTERTRVVAICNPNDPTGELLPVAELRRLLDALPERVVVLLDEALRDFADAEPLDATLGAARRPPARARLPLVLQGLGPRRACAAVTRSAGPAPSRCCPSSGRRSGSASWRRPARSRRCGARRAPSSGACARSPPSARGSSSRCRGRRRRRRASQANILWLRAEGIDGAELAGRMARSGVIVRAGGSLGDARMIRAAIHDARGDRPLPARAVAVAVRLAHRQRPPAVPARCACAPCLMRG